MDLETIMKWLKRFSIVLLVLLSACSDGMNGTFEVGGMGAQSLAFHGNGEATQTVGGMETQLEYEVEGDRIELRNPAQPGVTLVLTREDADTLVGGPMGMLEFKGRK